MLQQPKFKLFLMPLLLVLGVTSFIFDNNKVSDAIVLRIGKVDITEYEFEKNFGRFQAIFKQKYQKAPSEDSVKSWINNFIDDTILLAEAYELGYQNNPEIEKKVDFMARKMLTKRKGPLYDEVVTKKMKPIDSLSVMEAYNKRQTKFTIAYLEFKTHEDLISLLGPDSIISSRYEFESTVLKSKSFEEINHVVRDFSWPDLQLYEIQEQIFQMKEEETSKPLYTLDGIYIVHVYHKGQADVKPFELAKSSLENLLGIIERTRLEVAFDNQIYKSVKISIRKEICDKIINEMKRRNVQKVFYLDSLLIHGQMKKIIVSYTLESMIQNIIVEEFFTFYNTLPLKSAIKNKMDLYKNLREMVFEECAFRYATEKELHRDKKFQLDRKNYKNNLILNEFLLDKTIPQLKINNQELETALQNMIISFTKQDIGVSKEFEIHLKEDLRTNLMYEKARAYKTELVKELRWKFRVENKIDYTKYLSHM